jgi:hypothetical protein
MNKTIGMILASAVAASPLFAEEAAVEKAKSEGPQFSVAGEVEFEANALYYKPQSESKISHDYSSTFNLVFSVKFNDKWSAEAAISADDDNAAPGFAYDGAFIQYQMNDNIAIKAGDFTYSEGAFRYYDYDDPGDAAIGMTERDIRGLELNLYGLTLGLGFGRGDDDCVDYYSDGEALCKSYDVHAAYDITLGSHTIRPYANYQSYQQEHANRLRAGVTATLVFGEFANVQVAYGLRSDLVTEDEPKMVHAFAVEPEFNFGKVNVKASAFYSIIDEDEDNDAEYILEVPEYMFFYVEPSFAINDQLAIGLQGEYHTMTTDADASLETIFVGPRVYINPMEQLSLEGYVRVCLPIGDDYSGDEEDAYFGAGATVGFTF